MNKEEQKKLLTEIMEDDAKDGIYHTGDTNKMVTALEWFWIHLEDTISKEYFDLFQQAKEIEKNQIKNAFNYGNHKKWGSESQINSGEDYYKEKYQ